jgi:hypothetical protein
VTATALQCCFRQHNLWGGQVVGCSESRHNRIQCSPQ